MSGPYRTFDEEIAAARPKSARDLPIAPKWNPAVPSDTPDAICANGKLVFQGRRIHVDVVALGAEIVACRACGAMWGQTGVNP